MSHSTDIEQRLRGENPEHCVVTDRLRANIGMPDTFQFDRDDAVELDELVLEAADEIARLEADNASLRSKLEEAERALEPFATILEEYDPEDDDDNTPGTFVAGSVTNYELTLGDLRRARRTLASLREADHA